MIITRYPYHVQSKVSYLSGCSRPAKRHWPSIIRVIADVQAVGIFASCRAWRCHLANVLQWQAVCRLVAAEMETVARGALKHDLTGHGSNQTAFPHHDQGQCMALRGAKPLFINFYLFVQELEFPSSTEFPFSQLPSSAIGEKATISGDTGHSV